MMNVGDITGIFKKAKNHGLNYGATCCIKSDLGFSFLSLARSDRELTNEEVVYAAAKLKFFVDYVCMDVDITEREKQVILLLSQGLSQSDVSARMQLSGTSIKNSIQVLKNKFSAENTTEVIAQAIRRKLI